MDNNRMLKEFCQLGQNFRQGQAALQCAEEHIKYKNFAAAADDLQSAFARLAPLPPRINHFAERCALLTPQYAIVAKTGNKNLVSAPVCVYETPHIFHCSLEAPPFLRDQKNGRYYAEIVGTEVSNAVSNALHSRSHRFREVDVVFVNWITAKQIEKQPYYDNDNLLIKRILDSIISFVAVDDAAQYCTNIYTYGVSERPKFSVFVIESGHLLDWAETHTSVKFAMEIIGKPSEKQG